MTRLRTPHIATMTEMREPHKVLEQAKGQPVAILKNSAVVAYLVPTEAITAQDNRYATREEVMAHLAESRDRVQPVLDYLKDK